MPARSITYFRRLWRLLPALVCAGFPALARASYATQVYTVNTVDRTPAALAQAMRTALVRATGHVEVGADPALAGLISGAQRYVLGYLPGPSGTQQVMFDGPAIDQAIRAAGLSVWGSKRPFTLVVLSPAPPQRDQSSDAAALNQAAELRGLPISVVPIRVRDANGRILPARSLLATAQSFSATELLIGHPIGAQSIEGGPVLGSAQAPLAGTGGGGQSALWRWTLVTPFMTRHFTGSISSGIDRTVALLAPPVAATAADRVREVRVRIENVATLPDYARVETMLAAAPGVERAMVARVVGASAGFDLWVRGGAVALARMLEGSARFQRIEPAAGLVFRYRPPVAADLSP